MKDASIRLDSERYEVRPGECTSIVCRMKLGLTKHERGA